jgi:predicted phage terminase large subunit-like protein
LHVRRAGEALHPELESVESLKELRRQIGSDVFAAQYQQSPVPPGGAMIRRAWLRYYDKLPERTYGTTIIQSWDTASKDGAQNDWSVCTTWMLADNCYYLMDLTRGRYDYPRLKATATLLAQKHRPEYVLIEDASTGTALAQELESVHFGGAVRLVPIERDKIGRLYINQAKFEAGLVLFPKGAPFLPELEAELLTFPQGKHDDMVDSISQALSYRSSYDSTYSGWL